MSDDWDTLIGAGQDEWELDERIAELEAQVMTLRTALRELIAMVIPATGVNVDAATAQVARDGIMAYLNLTEGDLDPVKGHGRTEPDRGQRNIRDEIAQLRKWAYRRFEEIKHTEKAPVDETTENVAARTHWRDPESLLGRLHPSAWLKVSQNDERGDFVAVIHMVHPPDESTYHYGRGKTRADAVRAAHDGFERVIAMNKARDGKR